MNVSVLLIVSVSVVVIFAHMYKLGVPATVISLGVGGGAPAGTYLAWETIRQAIKSGDRRAQSSDNADKLAGAVLKQWGKEYLVRKFNDTVHDLTVSWAATESAVMTRWEDLIREATRGLGAQKGARCGEWAVSAQGLAGSEHELATVLERVPTGWLVVLGGPGYGKSMLMLRLVVDIVRQREPGGLVPVFVPMTSWDPENNDLCEWLEKQLASDYPGLDATVPGEEGKPSRITVLLAEQKVMPILDGLDEMPLAARGRAIDRLNEAFTGPTRPLRLVMTCRTTEYKAIVNAPGKPRKPVRGAAAIELRALDADMVADYLSEHRNDDRWAEVVQELSAPISPLLDALKTPLYASLASAIYNPHRYHMRGKVPEPRDLCDRTRFPDPDSIRYHLLDEFIPSMYSKEQEAEERRAREEKRPVGLLPAERRLMFIASYLAGRDSTTLKWWDLKGLAPSRLPATVVGLVSGIAACLTAALGTHVGVGIGVGFGTGMLIALAIGLGTRHARERWDKAGFLERYEKRRPGPGMAGGMIGAVIGGLAAGIAGKYHIGHEAKVFSGLPGALGIAIGAGATTEFFGGLIGTLIGSFVAGYLEAVGLGLPSAVVNGLAVGVAAGCFVWYLGRQGPSSSKPAWEGHIGIPSGLVVGLVIAFIAGPEEGVVPAIATGLMLAAAAALPLGLRHRDEDLDLVPSPGQALTRDASAFRRTALSAGLAAGAVGFIGLAMTSISEIGAKPSLTNVFSDGIGVGLTTGLAAGLTFGSYHAASPDFRIINWWLASRGKVPWRLKHFLDDAHQKTVLRQAGAAFEFRHVILRNRLAARLKDEQQRSAAATAAAGQSRRRAGHFGFGRVQDE